MSQPEPGEFDFLAADASMVGATSIPTVRRVGLGSGTSALAWGDAPARVVLAHGAALNAHTWDSTLLAWSDAVSRGDGSPGSANRGDGSPGSAGSDAVNRGDGSPGSAGDGDVNRRNRPLGSGREFPGVGFLALDLPGHGDSAWREDGDYAPARIASAIADALDAAHDNGILAPEYVFIGQSLGGLVGLELLAAARASFDRLVLIDILPLRPAAASMVASFLDGPTSFASREEIVDRARTFGLGGASLERGVFLNTRVAPDGRVVWKHHLGALGPQALQHLTTDHLWDVIAASQTPIDLVAATLSLVDDTAWNRFTTLRPDAAAVRLSGGHNLQEDSPVELARTLRRVLTADPPEPGE